VFVQGQADHPPPAPKVVKPAGNPPAAPPKGGLKGPFAGGKGIAKKPAAKGKASAKAKPVPPKPKVLVYKKKDRDIPRTEWENQFPFRSSGFKLKRQIVRKPLTGNALRDKEWPTPQFTVDGWGDDGEKQDAWFHIGRNTLSADEFNHWAWKNPGVKSRNYFDQEPESHVNGITNA